MAKSQMIDDQNNLNKKSLTFDNRGIQELYKQASIETELDEEIVPEHGIFESTPIPKLSLKENL